MFIPRQIFINDKPEVFTSRDSLKFCFIGVYIKVTFINSRLSLFRTYHNQLSFGNVET